MALSVPSAGSHQTKTPPTNPTWLLLRLTLGLLWLAASHVALAMSFHKMEFEALIAVEDGAGLVALIKGLVPATAVHFLFGAVIFLTLAITAQRRQFTLGGFTRFAVSRMAFAACPALAYLVAGLVHVVTSQDTHSMGLGHLLASAQALMHLQHLGYSICFLNVVIINLVAIPGMRRGSIIP